MPSLQIPATTPKTAGPKSAGALDFEAITWREAVNNFRMQSDHKAARLDEFLKTYSTPQGVAQTLRERQREAPNQYGPVLTKILGKIDIFLAAGDIAVKGAPESVGLAWTGISLALGSVQDDFATFQLFSGACVDIIGIMVSCRLFGRLFATSQGPPEFYEIQDQVRNAIPRTYGRILEFSYAIFKYMDRSKFLRITRGILKNNKEEFAGQIKDIKEGERLMSDNAGKASQALMSHFQKEGSLKQDRMLEELKQISSQLNESTTASKEMADYLKKELEEQRRRTPMDVAREIYAKNKQSLRAIVDAEGGLSKRKSLREEGTCNWIFDTEAFQTWHDSSGSAMLWISGGGNMGKSVLVSKIIDHLRLETQHKPDENAFFFFCRSGDDNAQKTDRIMDHLLAYLYDLVPMTLEILDRCNDICRQYLAARSEGRSKRRTQQDATDAEKILYFEEAFLKMAEALKKRVFIVLDALDECSDRKEEELVQRLASMTKRNDLNIKILVTSRPESDLTEAMETSSVPDVRVERFTEDDIDRTVEAQLQLIPGMTSNERKVARLKICQHAGPYFGYLSPALDLLRRPWQRPIEMHLQQLPENLLNMNARIFQNTDPSYIGFLKTCLTWAILANGEQKLRIHELIDIYSERFLIDDDGDDEAADEVGELDEEVKFYRQQIRKAGDTFLDLDEKTKELNLIKPALVKDSFLRTTEQANELRRRNSDPEECHCKNCQMLKKEQGNFILTARDGHLEIALRIFKHLNSPRFQRKYLTATYLVPSVATSSATTPTLPATSPNEPVSPISRVSEEGHPEEVASETSFNSVESSQCDSVTGMGNGEEVLAAPNDNNNLGAALSPDGSPTAASPNGSKPTLKLNTEESISTDEQETAANNSMSGDHSQADDGRSEQGNADEADDDDEVTSLADSDIDEIDDRQTGVRTDVAYIYPRYEIANAIYHLQMVEEHWLDETEKPEAYEELYHNVLEFLEPNSRAFQAWQIQECTKPGSIMQDSPLSPTVTPLHIAAANGLVELSKRLLDRQRASNVTIPSADLAKLAIDTNDAAAIPAANEALSGGIDSTLTDINARTENGITPIWLACTVSGSEKRYKICELLLKNGALTGLDSLRESDDRIVSQEPPFHWLLYNKDTEARLVNLFLEYGAKVDEIDPYGLNCVHDFAWVGSDPAILDMLVAKGADINVKDDGGETPLHKLLSGRDENMPITLLERFLHHKADISLDDREGQQALYEVAQGGNVEALRLLLAHEPPPAIDHKDKEGWTALHCAARYGNTESCKLLCAAGADLLEAEDNSCLPVYVACRGDSVETLDYMVQVSLEKFGDVLHMRNKDMKSVLRKCSARGKTDMVKMLLQKYKQHLDINAADKILHWTSLHVAAYQGFTEIVEALLDHGANVSAQDKRSKTALVLCYEQWELLHATDAGRNSNYEASLVALIEADRAAAVAQTHLLSTAARKGSIPVLEALILARPGQPKADPVLRDEFGWTAVELARQYKRQAAVDFLQSHSGVTGRYPEAWRITKPKLTSYDADTQELRYSEPPENDDELHWDNRVTVFADCPIPANLDRYYYELTVDFPDPIRAQENKHYISFGVFALASRWSNAPGMELSFVGHAASTKRGTQSWGYHGDDGSISNSLYSYNDEHQSNTETFGHGDTVGCGVDFRKSHIFWTRNGVRLMEKAFDDVSARLTPAVSMLYNVKVKTTFAKPFKWTPADDLDFDADIPQPKVEEQVAENLSPLDGPGNSRVSYEEAYRAQYHANLVGNRS